jgi:orotate phosphoribosyltransferase
VITAGTAIREVMAMVDGAGAEAVGVVIGLDRKERGSGEKSAIEEVEAQFGMSVVSIIDIDDILNYLAAKGDSSDLIAAIAAYRNTYGVA